MTTTTQTFPVLRLREHGHLGLRPTRYPFPLITRHCTCELQKFSYELFSSDRRVHGSFHRRLDIAAMASLAYDTSGLAT